MLKAAKYEDVLDRPRNGPGPNLEVKGNIQEFMNSDMEAALVEWTENYKNIYSACAGYRNAIKRMGLDDNVKVIQRGDKMYLMKPRSKKIRDYIDP